MLSKRHFREEDDELELAVQKSKRRLTLASTVRDVMRGLSMQEFSSKLEPLLRKVVREEVERGILLYIHSSPRPSFNQIEASVPRSWRLHFKNKLPGELFTGSSIEGEGNTPVQIVILDGNSEEIITTGPLSSIKIEILVLDGDFGRAEQEDWTKNEFDARVIREREGKRPLVIGDLVITLRDGVGYLGKITFTDNSSWIRSRRFRLGARPVRNTCNEERIREARSGAFMVKDHRGELYKKHHPPSFGDEIWRLEKIGKDGAFHSRLASNRIYTVQDFLRLCVADPSLLRSILGSGMSKKTYDTIIQHASACVLDSKRYMYSDTRQRVGLVFDSIYRVVGATFDGHYHLLDNFNTFQMSLVEVLKQKAYKNLNDIVEIDEPSVDVPSRALLGLESPPCPASSLDVWHSNFSITPQDQLAPQLGFNAPTNSTPNVLEGHSQLEDVAIMYGCHPIQLLSTIQRNSFNMRGSFTGPSANDGNECFPGGSLGPAVLGAHLTGNDISQVQIPSWFPVTTMREQGNGMFVASNGETDIDFLSSMPDLSDHIFRSCKPKMQWVKLKAAIKWGICVRKDVLGY